ncbi:hypothetical protein [Bacillus suaedaesalsae]|uniref:Uncharacterized protein n=1 Tax=Bacillus suaedaesalsae TaxID=2810349 RepID=A0ABS2DHE9_9BACI|nr:hypothetical protein [Bacillus suaedaesalsae]MBM6617888.1 hypothetical protein [Bacillus suaedaesalsae]
MAFLTILLTFIQFGILFYLFFKVRSMSKQMEQQQQDNNEILVAPNKLNKG